MNTMNMAYMTKKKLMKVKITPEYRPSSTLLKIILAFLVPMKQTMLRLFCHLQD